MDADEVELSWGFPYPTQFLGEPEDTYTGVVDYDGETLRVAFRPTRRKFEDNVRFDFQGEGPMILSVSEARKFLHNALEAIGRGEIKAKEERENVVNK